MISPPPCIILAGGLGTRLKSAVPNVPKCLAPIDGRPFLELQILSFVRRGIQNFVLALGHGSDAVLESLKQPWAHEISIKTVIEPELLGTGGAALFAMNELGLDDALIANGDTFLGGSLTQMLNPLDLDGGEFMRIATVQVLNRQRFGGVEVDATNHVTAFLEKGHEGAGLINAGFYHVNRHAFHCETFNIFSMETEIMPCLVTKRALQARELAGPFIDIGVPEDYRLLATSVHDYVSKG